MAKVRKNNAYAVMISAVVIVLLILAGPAQGFVLNLGLNNNNPEQGQEISFTVELDIEAGEHLPVELITMTINGPTDLACQFDAQGNPIVGCNGMTISMISYPTYTYGYGYGYGSFGYGYFGYGYGYGPGKLAYKVKLDTTNLDTGSYNTNFQIKIKNKNVEQSGPVFVVKAIPEEEDDDDDDNNRRSSGSCVTSYICNAWSACENGRQTRTCTKDVQYCYAGSLPEVSRSCNDFENLSGGSNTDREIKLSNTSTTTNSTPNLTARITGAVVGLGNTEDFNEDSLLFLVAAMVFVLALIVLLLLIRRASILKAARSSSFY